MTKTEMNSTLANELSKQIEKGLEELGEKLGVNICRVGGGKYDENSLTFKITATLLDEDGNFESQMRKDYKTYMVYDSELKDKLDSYFLYNGEKYQIVGFKPKSRKYPIIGATANGKEYKFTKSIVKEGLV